MKGPFERLKYDLRRQWECPACHRRERTGFTTTFRMCTCQKGEGGDSVTMRLIEDGVRRVWGTAPAAKPPIDEVPELAAQETSVAGDGLPATEDSTSAE